MRNFKTAMFDLAGTLLAAKKVQVSPEYCLVYEDTLRELALRICRYDSRWILHQ